MILRLSDPILSSLICTGGYNATIHKRSPFHFHGSVVPCNARAVHTSSGPDISSIMPGSRGPPEPPFEGVPVLDDRQNARVHPCSANSLASSLIFRTCVQ